MAKFSQTPQYSDKFTQSINKALTLHNYQVRKDDTPYSAHLLKVAGECLRLGSFIDPQSQVTKQLLKSSELFNTGELTALAGVFHDTLEDIPNMNETKFLKVLDPSLGKNILRIVKEVSENKNLSGFKAKEEYAVRIPSMSTFALIVSMVDKYDNIEGYCNLLYRGYPFNVETVVEFYKLLLPAYKHRISLTNRLLRRNLEEKLTLIAQKTSFLVKYLKDSKS